MSEIALRLRLEGVGVALAAFAVYALTSASAPYLLDSAELAAASFGLGVAHPPGQTLALLWGKAFTLLPLGSVAFRVSLSQAAAGACAVALVYAISGDLAAALAGRPLARWERFGIGLLAALGFGASAGTVLVSNRPEVYALQTALSLGALRAALGAREDPRSAALAALLVGLGLTNHPLLALLMVPALLAVAWPALTGRALALSALAGTASLAVLVYLPARAGALAASADAILWGDPRSMGGLWWVLSARTFTDKSSVVHTAASPEALPFVLMEEVGPLLALLAVGGGLLAARRRDSRAQAIGIWLALAGSAGAALWAGLDPANPDIRGYLGVALAGTAILGAATAAALPLRAGRAVAATALAVTAWHASPVPRPAQAHTADALVGEALAALPPRARLLSGHFETAFLLSYQRVAEGRRPDVAWAHLGFVRGPGYAQRVQREHPALAGVLAAHARGALTATGPTTFFEADEHLHPALRAQLRPFAGWWRVAEDGPAPASLAGHQPAHDRQLRGFLAWRAYQDALLACENRLSQVARLRLEDLRVLVPADGRARALVQRCLR